MFVGLTWYLVMYWICLDEMRYTCDLGAQITRTFGTVAPFSRYKKRLSLTCPLLSLSSVIVDQWWTKSKISLGLLHSTYNIVP